MSTFAELFEAEAQQAAPKAAPPKTPKTDKQAQGVADLDTMIGQMQANLRDVKPGTEMHARLTRDLAEAQKERSRYGAPAQPSGSFADQFEALAAAPAAAPAPAPAPAAQQAKTVATDLASQFGELRRKLGAATASLADVTVGGVIPAVAGPVTYAGARALGRTPEQAAAAEQAVVQATEKPFGKMLGVTQEPAYQQEASRRLMDFIGENIGKGAQWIAEKTGLPVQDVQNMIGTGMVAAPAGVKAAGQVAKPAVQAVAKPAVQAVAKPIQQAMAELEGRAPVQGQVMTPQAVQQMQAQFAARQPGAKAGSIGAAMVEGNPFAGQLTGEESARGMFPQVKLSKTTQDVPAAEQSTRASIINEVLGTGQVRPGVVTGNENTLRTEYTMAKHPERGPANELLKRQIAEEQVALSNYAEQRVANTGASPTLMTPFERGERINNFFAGVPAEGEGPSSVVSFFRQEKQRVYDQARQQVGNNPITTGHVDALLSDPQFKAGLKLQGAEGVATGASELIDLARTTGFKDTAGNFYPPNTIGAWDAVRKSLNADWTPANAKVIRKINRAIDQDIASAGGGNLLKMADSIHEAEKTIFGSKGIKNLFGEIDSNGVETGRVSFDALPQRLNSMPFNEWRHIYDTADKLSRGELFGPRDPKTGAPKWSLPVPPEVQAAAQNAKAEMLGNLAREVQQAGAAKAGVWSQNAANKVLNARADKIKYAFPLEEQQAFHKLNYAGQLMPGEHGYEGAALQQRRVGLIESQIPRAATGVGAAAGGLVAGPTGAAVGGYVMGKAGGRAAEKLAERAARKEAERLQEEMKKTSKLSELGK